MAQEGRGVNNPGSIMTTEAWGFAIMALGAAFVLVGHTVGLDTQLTATISSTIIGSGCTVFTSAVKPSISNSPNSNIQTEKAHDPEPK